MSGTVITGPTPLQFTSPFAPQTGIEDVPPSQTLNTVMTQSAKTEKKDGEAPDERRIEHVILPTRWERWRLAIQEPAAEFLGTAILVGFGNAVNCQVALSMNKNVSSVPKGDFTSLSFGWAVGIVLGVVVSGDISGGHINPAITLSLAVFRKFPWRKVPVYMFAQLLGGFFGSLIVYANYINAIDVQEGGRHIRTTPGTAGLFATFPLPYVTSVSAFFQEFIATAILLIAVLSSTDNAHPSSPLYVPTVLGVTLLGISAAFGMQTSFAMNPARDLGPRIMTAVVGYGRAPFNFRNQYWVWCPIIATFTGALFGSVLYDFVFFTGPKSVFNRQRSFRTRAQGVDIGAKAQGVDNVTENGEIVFRPQRHSEITVV